ncbi:MAG: trehalose utilization protein [Acidobacteria bacterium]|nr:MAG: trehalose utilization protein [Acidobacteriota bacterium]
MRILVPAFLGCALCAAGFAAKGKPVRVLLWSEQTEPREVYPHGISGALEEHFKTVPGFRTATATLADDDAGVSDAALDNADVLVWFGHRKHRDVPDAAVERIVRHVREKGMGFVALHSSHFSKPLKALLDATGAWSSYVNTGDPERIWVVLPEHPIAKGLRDFTIPKTEIYTEPFQLPEPEAVVLEGTWPSGHRSRECLTWTVGKGRLVYIRAGHEQYPIFFMSEMRQLAANAVQWAAGRTAAPRNLKRREAGPPATASGPYKKTSQ